MATSPVETLAGVDRRPLSRRRRLAMHAAFVVSILAVAAFLSRAIQQPHVALGFDIARSLDVSHVARGSAAEDAGLRVGDAITPTERLHLQAALGSSFDETMFSVLRDGRATEVRLPAPTGVSLRTRLKQVDPARWVFVAVGLIAMLIGWVVVRLNPDAEGIAPFALWSASTLPLYTQPVQSAAWTAGFESFGLGWRLVAEALFQGFALHWLLRFPRRLSAGRQIVLVHALIWVVTLIAAGSAIRQGSAFMVSGGTASLLMNAKEAAVAFAAVTLVIVQLSRARTRQSFRRAAWVFLGIGLYAFVDVVLWVLPDLLPVSLPVSASTLDVLLTASYLIIPAGIAVATTREGLFGIDRVLTRGLTYALALAVLGALYATTALAVAVWLGRQGGSLPIGWGVFLALSAALLLQPVLRWTRRAVERVFDRRGRRHRAAMDRFERSSDDAVVFVDVEQAVRTAVADGLGSIAEFDLAARDRSGDRISARPGVLDVNDELTYVELDDRLDVAFPVVVPFGTTRASFGRIKVGPPPGDTPFTDDDLRFLRLLARRAAHITERLKLREEVLAGELVVANTRLRIAADLHDDLGANLSSIALLTDAVRTDGHLGEEQRAKLERAAGAARDMLGEMRDIVWSIDPARDRFSDLITKMQDTASMLLPGIRCRFSTAMSDAPDRIPMPFRRDLFLAYKEALHNVARHARATEVGVEISIDGKGRLTLTIHDNGSGWTTLKEGTGLRSMRERAERLGGSCDIQAVPGEGTTVRFEVQLT